MGGRHISVDEARALAATVLKRAGLPADEAAAVAGVVVWSEPTGSGLTRRNAYYVERLAEHGWVALMANNFPAVVAPHGSSEAVFGTNPLSAAMPAAGGPLVVERVRRARPADHDVPVRAPNDRALASMGAVRARGIALSDELADALENLR